MFGWLFRPDPMERGLFAYRDGHRGRLADPLAIDPVLRKDGRLGEWLAVLNAVDRVPVKSAGLKAAAEHRRDEAINGLVDLTRTAFGIPAVDDRGRGLSGAECLNVLAQYLTFLANLKERYGPLPISPARPAPSPGESDTGEWSVSGSTGTDSGASEPTILPGPWPKPS